MDSTPEQPGGRERPSGDVPKSRLWERFLFAWLIVGSFIWRLSFLRFDFAHKMYLTQDYPHQVALLNWFYRSLFLGEGSLFSPPFFFPEKGVLAISEAPIIFGIMFGFLRLLSLNPLLTWNLLYGLSVMSAAPAMYLALRGERLSVQASFFGAVLYLASPWLGGIFGEGIWYRAAFGPPLAWYFLTRIKNEGPTPKLLIWLSSFLVVQFGCCMNYALSTCLLVATRVLVDPGLRKREWLAKIALTLFPVGGLGLLWQRITTPYILGMGLDPALGGTHEQMIYRMDATHLFLPHSFLRPASGFDQLWPQMCDQIPIDQAAVWVALVFAVFAIWQGRVSPLPNQAKSSNRQALWPYVVIAFLGLLSIHGAGFRLGLIFPQLGSGQWFLSLMSDTVWIGIVALAYRSMDRGGFVLSSDSPLWPPMAVLGVFVSLGLGPLIFALGRPILVGPLAVLNVILPGIERIHTPVKLLVPGVMSLSILAAAGFEELLQRLGPRRWFFATGPVLVFTLSVIGAGFSHIGGYPFGSPSFPEEACPDCTDNDYLIFPLPYKYLRESAPGEALLELPMGKSVVPMKGKPPVGGHDPLYIMYFALDRIPRLNGLSSYETKSYMELITLMESFPELASIEAIRKRQGKWLLIHGDRYEPARWAEIQQALEPPPAGLRLEKKWGPVWLYRVE